MEPPSKEGNRDVISKGVNEETVSVLCTWKCESGGLRDLRIRRLEWSLTDGVSEHDHAGVSIDRSPVPCLLSEEGCKRL